MVAVALADDDMRQLVYNSLRSSPYRENKLHFQRWSDGAGVALLQRIASNTRLPGGLADVKALRDGAIPFEMYVPVKAHRAAWKGGTNLIVATALRDHEIPVAYNLSGQRVVLASAEDPPEIPTLVLVPVETNFDALPPASLEECNPEVIVECDDETSGGFGPPPTAPGLYMQFSYIPDDHEGFAMGGPEFEVQPSYRLNPASQTMTFNQCSGEHAGAPGRPGPGIISNAYAYDQQNLTWNGYVMLLSAAQLNQARAVDSAINYWVLEDDNTECLLKKDTNDVDDYIGAVAGVAGITLVAFVNLLTDPISTPSNWWKFVSALVGGLQNDDLVGIMVPPSSVGQTYSDANRAIVDDDGVIAGRANLIFIP